ncbi:MAG: MBL fold metallo-hydrolase [Pyrinomonadaceae bacterium]
MANNISVRVRMYRQGLGDCFLLTFMKKGKKKFNMMIDCGLFLGTQFSSEIMKAVADDVKTETNSRLNVVALTHEHYDHISGFKLAKDIFQDPAFVFDEVWVAWTENQGDPKFKEVRERFEKKKRGLRAALNGMSELNPLRQTINSLVNEFFGEGEEDAVAVAGLTVADGIPLPMTNADTWKYVLEKSVAQPPRYCSPAQSFGLAGVDEVKIYILGPPEDFELLDDEESPEDETYRKNLRMAITDSFLAAATEVDNADFDTNTYLPFDDKYPFAYDLVKADESANFFRDTYGFDQDDPNSWRRIDDEWLGMAGELALNIDGITNNTCLAIAIELVDSKKVLIFPGDAQFGNWISWQKLKWETIDASGNKVEINVNDLLKRTVFYKVGHHGSHNATLKKSGLEKMESPELVAMIPTNQAFAKTKNKDKGGWRMPEKELMDTLELKAQGRVILADEAGVAGNEKNDLHERCKKLKLSGAETQNFLRAVTFGGSFVRNPTVSSLPEPLWVEYTIEG